MFAALKQSRIVPWLAVSVWLALVCYLMLSPSRGTRIESVSEFFGGTDVTDAIGHTILFGVLTVLLWWALAGTTTRAQALRLAAVSVIVLGTLLEFSQLIVVDRGLSLLDLSANWIGPGLVVEWERRQQKSAY